VFGDADVNRTFRRVKLGARLKQIDRRYDCLRARGAAGILIVSTSEPMPKLSAANGPGFTMAVDREIGEGGAIGAVKQRFGRAGKGKGERPSLWCFAVDTIGSDWSIGSSGLR
jgi:hypothetical protein